MHLNQFIQNSLDQEQEWLFEQVQDLSPQELAWRPAPEANPMGWVLWHMLRVEDFWLQFFIQGKLELWESDGWHEKFALPTRDTGFQHTNQQAADFPQLDLGILLDYGKAVRASTLEYVATLTPEQFDVVPRQRRPEMTVGQVFRQITGEFYQHLGHIAYIKGLKRGPNSPAG